MCVFYYKLGEEEKMEQYTASGDQIVVQAANGQIQQQVRGANVNKLLFNQSLLPWKKGDNKCVLDMFSIFTVSNFSCMQMCISCSGIFKKHKHNVLQEVLSNSRKGLSK